MHTMTAIDIRFTGRYETEAEWLSNLADKPFTFRGVRTRTIEGILQSVKVYGEPAQSEFWSMNGFTAKKHGRNINWQDSQVLWWDQTPMDRLSDEYQTFLDELYGQCYAQNPDFRRALASTKESELQHTIGNIDPEFTILTVEEFLSRLRILRSL